MHEVQHKAGDERPAEGRLAKQHTVGASGREGCKSRRGAPRATGHCLAGAPLPGVTAGGDVKFLEAARRGPNEPLQNE